MSSYYIDYENVHNEGLNGVDKLEQGDRLCLFYSCKADTLKIDVVRQLMKCAADIRFEKIDNGVENALDFQLITALMCNYSVAESYYIISKDKGYDAAIEMAAKQGRDNIYRCRDIDGALKHQSGLGIDESDQEVIVELNLDADRSEDDAYGYEQGELQYEQEADVQLPEVMAEEVSAKEVPAEAEAEVPVAQASEEGSDDGDNGDNGDDAEGIAEEADASGEGDEPEAASREGGESGNGAEPTAEELQRRAYQSICTKLLNHIKLNHKIPVNYKQAGVIYEALAGSDSKMQFYHKLIQILGRKKGGELYQRVKTTYKSISGIYRAAEQAGTVGAFVDGAPDAAEAGAAEGNGGSEAREVHSAAEDTRSDFESAEQNQGNSGEW